jgi:CRISPR-associated protein Csb2
MLAISVELLHGTIRAGSPDDTVMAGGVPEGEWPPSPARLFSTLVAADGTRDRCRVTTGEELRALERAAPPRILATDELLDMTLNSRFVVRDAAAAGMVQNYPARNAAEVRPGVKASPREPVVVYVWDELELSEQQLDALRRRAARVGYLGCADSPVRVTVATTSPRDDLPVWVPGAIAGVSLPVPYDGFLDALDAAFDEWRSGRPMRRSWIPTQRARYALPARNDRSHAEEPESGTTLWLEFDRRVAAGRALLVNETLRSALLEHTDRLYDDGPAGRRAPWQLHGHAVPDGAAPYQLARFFSLANVGHRHSDGAIHGAAVWLPPGMDPESLAAIRHAAGRLSELRAPGLHVRLSFRLGEGGKWSTRPTRWVGPSRCWFAVTPVVAERGRRGGPTLADVRAWFTHAGFPEPVRATVSPVPTRTGVPRLRPSEVHRAGKDRHPFYWIEVEFDDPVNGPVCVGRSRSLGMGLLAPVLGREAIASPALEEHSEEVS